jgi:hypothetical protein
MCCIAQERFEIVNREGRVGTTGSVFAIWKPELVAGQVCPEFCVNDRVLFSGMGRWGRGHFPFSSPSL